MCVLTIRAEILKKELRIVNCFNNTINLIEVIFNLNAINFNWVIT